ncbi:hypothetical protein Q7P37_003880 [Cladosporium fusiforme]
MSGLLNATPYTRTTRLARAVADGAAWHPACITLLHSVNKEPSTIGYLLVLRYLKLLALRSPQPPSDRRPYITSITFDFRDVFVSTLSQPVLDLQFLRFSGCLQTAFCESTSMPSVSVIHHNPSTSFSTVSSAASATSVGSSRSGGSRLLFGEIDTASDRSSETIASVCSLVLSDSSKFLRFWLTDRCREHLISSLSKQDLANLRLVCHDFSVRAAPSLFEKLDITFKASTFTRPAKLAALDRLGFYVKHLTFTAPHTVDTFLPPLIHPETGDELNFTYTPQADSPSSQQAKYGDEDITELLLHQYPPLFHAATNVPAFIRGFSCFANLKHLEISCPGFDPSLANRRSTVNYTLTSLRIAIERNSMNSLDQLTLSPIHPDGLLSLSPLTGGGANPSSAKQWSSIKHLSISTTTTIPTLPHQRNPTKLLASYISAFQSNLLTFQFAWLGPKGPLPFPTPSTSPSSSPTNRSPHRSPPPTFPKITTLQLQNATASATALRSLALHHARTLQTLELTNVDLSAGSWQEAFAPLVNPARSSRLPGNSQPPRKQRAEDTVETADIPIMFAPPATPSRSPPHSHARSPLRAVHPAVRVRAQQDSPTPGRGRNVQFRETKKSPPVQATTPLLGCAQQVKAGEQTGKKSGLLGRMARVVRRFGG